MATDLLLALAIGYLLGSIPFGLVLTRLSGRGDVRAIGSGNIGATNVLRTGSKALAAATLVLDAFKATAAVVIAQLSFDGGGVFAAAGALIGHLYPVWIAALLITRISSAAGMAAVLSAPVSAALLGQEALFPILVAFALLVIWKHRENIFRLKAGTEPRVGRRSG